MTPDKALNAPRPAPRKRLGERDDARCMEAARRPLLAADVLTTPALVRTTGVTIALP